MCSCELGDQIRQSRFFRLLVACPLGRISDRSPSSYSSPHLPQPATHPATGGTKRRECWLQWGQGREQRNPPHVARLRTSWWGEGGQGVCLCGEGAGEEKFGSSDKDRRRDCLLPSSLTRAALVGSCRLWYNRKKVYSDVI